MKQEVIDGAEQRLDMALSDALRTASIAQADLLRWLRTQLDHIEYSRIQHRFRSEPYQVRKYLNLVYWIHHKFGQLDRFAAGLQADSWRELRILDIGCGPGHLGLAARYCGHHTIGLDMPLPEPHLYTRLCKFFGVEKHPHRLMPMTPLPQLGTFDRITATMVEFDLAPLWDVTAWNYFLDCCRSQLAPGGRIYITLTSNEARPREVWNWFEKSCRWSSGHHAFLFWGD